MLLQQGARGRAVVLGPKVRMQDNRVSAFWTVIYYFRLMMCCYRSDGDLLLLGTSGLSLSAAAGRVSLALPSLRTPHKIVIYMNLLP